MSKRLVEPAASKMSRNDRFAQMSNQERLIEEKKREIQAKLEARRKQTSESNNNANETKTEVDKPGIVNIFSNDGSFLDQFKQMKEKKVESRLKSFNKFKEREDKNFMDKSKWAPRKRSPSPLDRSKKSSRFSTEQKITINTSKFSSQHYEPPPPPAPLLRTADKPPAVVADVRLKEDPSLTEPPKHPPYCVMPCSFGPQPLNVLEQQQQQQQNDNQMVNVVLVTQEQKIFVSTTPTNVMPAVNPTTSLTMVSLPPPMLPPQGVSFVTQSHPMSVRPPGMPPLELASIPPPNPIQVVNYQVAQPPDGLNAMSVPPPTSIQVHGIPSASLNEMPKPKPMEMLSVGGGDENPITDHDFIKNVPPPNKSVPPPNAHLQTSFMAQAPQSVLIHTVSSAAGLVSLQAPMLSNGIPVLQVPPPAPPLQIQNTSNGSGFALGAPIPPLMGQTILPPPGLGVDVCRPPPAILAGSDVSQPPPNFINQPPPPITSQLPPMTVPPPSIPPPFRDVSAGTADFEAMASLARMVADCGPSVEDVVKQKKTQDPNLWFLFYKESAAYRQYAGLVEQYKRESGGDDGADDVKPPPPDPEDMYEPEMALEDEEPPIKVEVKQELQEHEGSTKSDLGAKRKRKSRWGDKDPNVRAPAIVPAPVSTQAGVATPTPILSKVTRNDPALLHYARTTYGSTNLSEEDWKKAEDNFKIHLLYQDMLKKREDVERLKQQGKNKYEYDSDEDTQGGTWEHKLREKEMTATERWATELTKQAEGKHHIGDFLPPEELKRFMEKSSAVKEGRQPNFSDYKEFKIKEDNIGFKMLQKLGWSEGQGLGSNNAGIVEPVNKGAPREHTQGLGLNVSDATEGEDEYESYRKRMMLAYRFRPNPLNNPRRPYY
ncbi:uncharacterized protein LOC132701865 isoform X2 [Cylas formicarius]|uniref:uncharacterized protein LOC132701865 isoform X2 n=1 Tax=Cylas formicarius TaxID=197179 RepID=UPI00295839D8|nr:uncharacterized protein LOC132701865 isoform X2 [Cylas formicarius]